MIDTTFDAAAAAHLLRRCLFGPTPSEIARAVDEGLEATLDRLLRPVPTVSEDQPPPRNHFFTEDPQVPIGATWIDKTLAQHPQAGVYRAQSLRGWYVQGLLNSTVSIQNKMALFWIEHFGMASAGEHRIQYQYLQLFREFATGNFRELVKRVTIHPSMLIFLNGNRNRKVSPDENFARELLELYTVQKGEPGTVNYSDEDIREVARIMTGWRVRGNYSRNPDVPLESFFDPRQHDDGQKQLSEHFGNAVFDNAGEEEYAQLIDVLFDREETARSICRDLYRFFVASAVDEGFVDTLTAVMIAEDYELSPVLRTLLSSDHFYSAENRGTTIKNPLELIGSTLRSLGGYAHLGMNLDDFNRHGVALYNRARGMEMDVLNVPLVAGWKAYYQSPAYYRSWISSPTLQQRQRFVRDLTGERGIVSARRAHPSDWLGFVEQLDAPFDVNSILGQIFLTFLPRPLHPDQERALKNVLLGGLPDQEWTRQWLSYQSSPNNPDVSGPIERKLREFFRALFSLAEFQLQ